MLYTVNCTSNKSLDAIASAVLSRYDIVFLQEHHLLGSGMQQAQLAYARQGIKSHLSPASPTKREGHRVERGFCGLQGHTCSGIPPTSPMGGRVRQHLRLPGWVECFV
jgi:hypothetical protein